MPNHVDELKEQIVKYNKLYRAGTPIVSDQEYDNALEVIQKRMIPAEFEAFRKTLMDGSGKVYHKYKIGSLNKAKAETDELWKWWKKYATKNEVFWSEKLDGTSITITYKDGTLYKAVTRGDGEKGEDVTDKVKHIKNVPAWFNVKKSGITDIRGETMLTLKNFELLKKIDEREYKNPRNTVAGLINNKEVHEEKLNLLEFFALEITTDRATKKPMQYKVLKTLGFKNPVHGTKLINMANSNKLNHEFTLLLKTLKEKAPYLMDGLVITAMDAVNEDEYYPKKMIAFKVNDEIAETTVKGIEWTISKGGLLKPVVLLNPVELGGTTVKRATGYNAKYIQDNGIAKGAKVKIVKSGDIIPKIIEVVEEADVGTMFKSIMLECPSCYSEIEQVGVDLKCTNKKCSAAEVKKVASFIKKMEVDGASETSLANWGITDMKKLLKWKPDTSYKNQVKFYDSFLAKVINGDKEEILGSMTYDGGGRRTIEKLLEFYGEEKLYKIAVTKKMPATYPEGIGEKVLSKVMKDFNENHKIMLSITSDKRRKTAPKAKKAKAVNTGGSLAGKSFVITGTLSQPRKYFQNLIKENGGKVASGVSKNLDYLIAGEKAGSKLTKAEKLGTEILTEKKFMGMIK
jgi:DNA ligase (NAD+)